MKVAGSDMLMRPQEPREAVREKFTLGKLDLLGSGYVVCPPEWQVDEEGSVFHRVYYVYGGEAVYHSSVEEFALRPLTLHVFPSRLPYQIRHQPDHPLDCLWFHLTTVPAILDDRVMRITAEDAPTVHHLCQALRSAVENRELEGSVLQVLCESVFLLLGARSLFLHSGDERLATILAYMHDHHAEPLTDACLAARIGFNEKYFIRLFRKTLRIAPQQYLACYRYKKAGRYLQQGISIRETADLIGFGDAKSFSRFFKRYAGVCPSEYRGNSGLWRY